MFAIAAILACALAAVVLTLARAPRTVFVKMRMPGDDYYTHWI